VYSILAEKCCKTPSACCYAVLLRTDPTSPKVKEMKKNKPVENSDAKKKREYDAKVAAIKAEVQKLVPMVKTRVPELPPIIGTLAFEHLTHPFKPSSNSPNLLGAKTVGGGGKSMADKLAKVLRANERKEKGAKKEAKRLTRLGTDNSDDDSADSDGSLPYVKRKAAENMRFEDFAIPDVVDAETGEQLDLTRATWSTTEGRVNFDVQSVLSRGALNMKISSRPDSSHRIVPIASPRVAKKSKFQRAGKKVMTAMMLGRGRKKNGDTTTTEDDFDDSDGSEEGLDEAGRAGRSGLDLSEVYRGQARNALGIVKTKKHHRYDETATITDDSANYWRRTDNERRSVYRYDHLVDGLTKEEFAEKTYSSSLHHLHIKFKDDGLGADTPHVHVHSHTVEEVEVHGQIQAAKHRMHPLVAAFLKNGPQQPMYHRYWDSKYDTVLVPEGYVNDDDHEADAYMDTLVKEELGAAPAEAEAAPQSARSTTSSVGFESAESILKDKKHPHKKAVGVSAGLSAQLDQVAKEGNALLKEGHNLPTGEEGEELSILSDALDPNNEVSWQALEDRYYFEIRTHALDYEANKLWTKEKPAKGGVGGMDIACRKFANWKMRSIKFIVQATDDEEKKELARLALEDELEIHKPERLLDQAKVHNDERHRHRTYIKTFKYDIEICALRKLNDMGLVW